jgi:hypothetical protein
MNSPRYQRGLGLAGWIIVMLVVGSITSLLLKLYTPFYDHYLIEQVMEKMEQEDGHANKPAEMLTNMIRQRLKMNNVRNFPLSKNMTIKRTLNGTEVIFDYEVRENLWKNIDIVSSFEKKVELRR